MTVIIVSAFSEGQKFIIKSSHELKVPINTTKLIIHDYHVIKSSRVLTLDKLTSTKIYSALISDVQNKPPSNIYFKNLFDDNHIDWAAIYMLPRLATYDA